MIEEALDRRGKSPDERAAIKKRANSWRARTIFFSIVASTIVALFIGYMNDKDQRDRSVKNCELTQADRRDRVDSLNEQAAALAAQADSTLGNKHPVVYVPPKNDNPVGTIKVLKKPIPKADFAKRPFSQFKDFKVLIITQAKANRASAKRNFNRAKKVKGRIENCDKVFPNPSLVP